MSHFQYAEEQLDVHSKMLKVAAAVPDDLVQRNEIRPPDLIKVDVQEHGATALAGSIESIRTKRPIIVFSNHSQWELAGTCELLEPLGYFVESLTGECVPWEFLNRESGILLPATAGA